MASQESPPHSLSDGSKTSPGTALKYASSLSEYSDPDTGEVWCYRGDICVEKAMTRERFREKYLQRRPVLFPFIAAASAASENENESAKEVAEVEVEAPSKSATKKFVEKLWEQCRDVSPHIGNRKAAGANATWQRKDISMADFVAQAAQVVKPPESYYSKRASGNEESNSEAEQYVFDKSLLLAPKMIQLLGELGVPEFLPRAATLQAILARTGRLTEDNASGDVNPKSNSAAGEDAPPGPGPGSALPPSNHLLLAVGFEGSGTSLHR